MTEARHQPVFAAVAALRDTLRTIPTRDAERALYHCERLEQRIDDLRRVLADAGHTF